MKKLLKIIYSLQFLTWTELMQILDKVKWMNFTRVVIGFWLLKEMDMVKERIISNTVYNLWYIY